MCWRSDHRARSGPSFDGIKLEGDLEKLQGKTVVVWCTKWNQGCFDAAIYIDGTLVTLQFTVAEKHSQHLEYIKYLRDAFAKAGVMLTQFAHVGINGDGDLPWESATGTGRSICTLDFTILRSSSTPLKQENGPFTINLGLQGTPVRMYTNKRPNSETGLNESGGDAMAVDD